MHVDQYTADAITCSMGLRSFIDHAWNSSEFSLRLVLTPSFHPEMCLDIKSGNATGELSAACLSEMLWHQSSPRQLFTFHEKKTVDRSHVAHIQSLCSTINADAAQPICLDGMGLHAAWINNGEIIIFNSHVYGETLSKFVIAVLEIAWSIFATPGVRNGIANCGQYVGLNYPLEPEPQKPTQLLVLGNPDDVADYFNRQGGSGAPR